MRSSPPAFSTADAYEAHSFYASAPPPHPRSAIPYSVGPANVTVTLYYLDNDYGIGN